MLNFIYLLRQIDRRFIIANVSLAIGWVLVTWLNTTVEELQVLKAQYPLSQQWQMSQKSDEKSWLKFKASEPLNRVRLKTIFQYLTQQFDLSSLQIKISEIPVSRQIKIYEIFLLLGSKTDVEIINFINYLSKELYPLVQLNEFSLHRSRTLDDSMVQQNETIQLIEGRLKLVWISK